MSVSAAEKEREGPEKKLVESLVAQLNRNLEEAKRLSADLSSSMGLVKKDADVVGNPFFLRLHAEIESALQRVKMSLDGKLEKDGRN